jgi:aspartyl-tRNA(Asn)/glutamyl-tRNA(Gln) amidotransferase subunit C
MRSCEGQLPVKVAVAHGAWTMRRDNCTKEWVCYQSGRQSVPKEPIMSVDAATVRRIAHLARIAVTDDEIEPLQGELNAMLAFVEQLSEVNVEGVEPMTSVTPMEMKKRHDVVTAGDNAEAILKNAPASQDNYFLVPKVIE